MHAAPLHSAVPSLPRRRAVRLAAGSALGLPFLPRPAHAAITWTLFCQQANQTAASVRGLRRMSDRVREATSGGLLIVVRTAGMVPIDANNVLAGVASGKVEMGDDGTYNTTLAPATLLRLPMLITSPQEFERAAGSMRPFLTNELANRGLVLLGHYRSAQQVFWSRRAATRFADINRQRIRVLSIEQAEFVRHYAGLHVTMAAAEMPAALEGGRADGTFSTAALGGSTWKAFLKHVYLTGPNYTDSVLVVGRAALERLPTALQPILRDAAADAADWITRAHDSEEGPILRGLAAEGLTVSPANAADIQEGTQKLTAFWDSWVRLRGAETDKLLSELRRVLDR